MEDAGLLLIRIMIGVVLFVLWHTKIIRLVPRIRD